MNYRISVQHQSFISKKTEGILEKSHSRERIEPRVMSCLFFEAQRDRREPSAQGTTSIFSFILAAAHLLFYPTYNTFSSLIESPSIARFYIAATSILIHGKLIYFLPVGLVCSFVFVRFRENGWKNSAVETDDLKWRRKERSTLIKVASILFFFFSFSFSVSVVDGFWQYFRRKTPSAHICLSLFGFSSGTFAVVE